MSQMPKASLTGKAVNNASTLSTCSLNRTNLTHERPHNTIEHIVSLLNTWGFCFVRFLIFLFYLSSTIEQCQ